MDELKGLINNYLGLIFKLGLILVIFSTFFLFSSLTTEFYETPKFLVLIAFTGVLLLLLALKFTVLGKVPFTRTPLDLPLLLLLAVAVVSTILSPSTYISLLGNQMRVSGSLVSIVVYILFYFVIVNGLKTAKEIRSVLFLTVLAGQILAVLALLSFAGVKILPIPWTQAPNFTPTGSSFSTTAVLAILIPLIVVAILTSTKPLFVILNSLFLLVTGATIALTGSWATWIAALFGLIISFLAVQPARQITQISPVKLISLITSLSLVVLITALSLIPPIGSAKNPIYTHAQNFPREIQLGFVPSWKVSISSFRDSPFWGTGPATYSFNFTNYKPIEFNSSKVWNLRFDSAFNEYLQTLATLGGIGIVALLSLTALFVSSASSVILSAAKDLRDSSSKIPQNDKVALAISGLTFFVILALHPATLVLWVMGFLILACFMATGVSESLQKSWNNLPDLKTIFANPSQETIKTDALPGVFLTIALAVTLFAFFFGGKFALADYHHRKALNAVTRNDGIATYNELVAAEKLNPYSDLYRTDLAQTNFALANAIASAKGPTEASPAGSLTDQDKQNIQVLLQQSIDEAKTAVTLSPRSAVNWEILGLLYRQIAGVATNGLQFSLDSYGRAIFQDPLNPQLRLNVGGVYYAIANYDLAIRFFTDAINLKPDFANGYYNLSVALRDKGDLNNALVSAQKVVELVDKNSPDYQIAMDYLNDLKTKAGAGEPPQPPAATTSGQLQNENLPKVVNLPKPEKIATPEAIKK